MISGNEDFPFLFGFYGPFMNISPKSIRSFIEVGENRSTQRENYLTFPKVTGARYRESRASVDIINSTNSEEHQEKKQKKGVCIQIIEQTEAELA